LESFANRQSPIANQDLLSTFNKTMTCAVRKMEVGEFRLSPIANRLSAAIAKDQD
jgi:hypothetical protein